MRRCIPVVVFALLSLPAVSFMPAGGSGESIPITWKTLTDVTFRERLNLQERNFMKIPTFGPTVRELEGKQVQIKGYMIPVSLPDDIYVISEKPMSSCFFCGSAGPETLMELEFKSKPRRFKTDEIRTLKGILQLNADRTDQLCYRMTSVEVVE
ncbi:MAG: hypothetical protein ABS46_18640 [Cytophagaceae bacterium SCN 52-12]|nr:MAG: hypothetical protein ABS46_18640 [Cytophagaceae bacterium SCN 52-12]